MRRCAWGRPFAVRGIVESNTEQDDHHYGGHVVTAKYWIRQALAMIVLLLG